MINQVSIIIPIYKNYTTFGKNVLEFYEFIKTIPISFELIIVNDGSKMPKHIYTLLTGLPSKIIFLNKNYGKGYALTQGVSDARGDFIMFTDADIPYQLENYKEMIKLAMSQNYDIIIGNRTSPSPECSSRISYLRSLGSKLFSKLVIRTTNNNEIKDTQCGLKGFRKEVAKRIFSKTKIRGFAIDVEILLLARLLNYRIYLLPVQLRENTESTIRVFKHGIQMLCDLGRIKYYQITKHYNEKL